MFSLGNIIICVNDDDHPDDWLTCPLRKGGEYEVQGMRKCACGARYVDVGLAITHEGHGIVCSCKRRTADKVWWFDMSRFRLKDGDQLELSFITVESLLEFLS